MRMLGGPGIPAAILAGVLSCGGSPDPSGPSTPASAGAVNLGPPAAFPECEGMGCGATGGRGGDVYTVNTLADTIHPECIPQNGPGGPPARSGMS